MMTNTLSQYWHLFRWLMIPARYHYWLFMLSMVATIIAVFSVVVGSLLNVGDWRLVFVGIWAVVFSIWSFSAVLVLHGQLMSLPSNRQLRLIPGLRQRALVIHWLVLATMSVLFTAFQFFLKEMDFSLTRIMFNWSLFLLASVAFLFFLKWFGNFSLLAVWCMGIVFSTFIWPLEISPWGLFTLGVVVCIGFSYWWLHWRPTAKIDNVFLLRNWQSLHNTSLNHWAKLPINMLALRIKSVYSPASLYLHLLNGVTGNPLSRVITWLAMGGVSVLSLSLIVRLGYGGALRDIAPVAIPITLWTFLSGAGMGYFTGLFTSIGRTWLYFPGTRTELLSAVEKNFVLSLLIDLFFVCALIGFACYWAFPEFLQMKWIMFYCLLVLAVNWLLFHFVWCLYCRTEGNSNLLGVAIFFIIMLQIFLAGVSWSLVSSEKISVDLLIVSTMLCCTVAALFLRSYAQKATAKMCFARGKV